MQHVTQQERESQQLKITEFDFLFCVVQCIVLQVLIISTFSSIISPFTFVNEDSLIPIYCVSEILCTCPQKCDEKIPLKVRTYMFKYYHALSRDRPKQEMLLLRFIEMKSLAQRLKEDNKRVQCRYKAPTCMKAIDFVIEDGEFFFFFLLPL